MWVSTIAIVCTLLLYWLLSQNDCLRFHILGRYSVALYLLLGLRQGITSENSQKTIFTSDHIFPSNKCHCLYPLGCNLSPLLFALFIASLVPKLLRTGLGNILLKIMYSIISYWTRFTELYGLLTKKEYLFITVR